MIRPKTSEVNLAQEVSKIFMCLVISNLFGVVTAAIQGNVDCVDYISHFSFVPLREQSLHRINMIIRINMTFCAEQFAYCSAGTLGHADHRSKASYRESISQTADRFI